MRPLSLEDVCDAIIFDQQVGHTGDNWSIEDGFETIPELLKPARRHLEAFLPK